MIVYYTRTNSGQLSAKRLVKGESTKGIFDCFCAAALFIMNNANYTQFISI